MGKKKTVKSNGKKVEKKPFIKNIIGGRVDGINIRAFEIRNANLWNCEIYVSKVLNSSLHNCKVFNSEIESSDIFDSKLHEVQLSNCGTSRCEVSVASLALRRFPPEIRRIILGYSIEPEYGVTPPVVVAFRGEPQLYGEVLELYYKRCVVPISPKTFKEYKKMPKRAFKEVTQVRIEFLDCKMIKEVLKCCTKLEKVEYVAMGDPEEGYDLDFHHVEHIVNDCKTLKVLDVIESGLTCDCGYRYDDDGPPLEYWVNKHLGFDGDDIYLGVYPRESDCTRWKAREGKPLRWTNLKYESD